MKLGLVADIHGNKPALEAVQEAMPDVDGVVCAGDVVGYNPWPAWCLEEFRDPDIPTVQGNHDRAVASDEDPPFTSMARAGVDHARKQLTDEQRGWLRELPIERSVVNGRLKVVHGHPDDPDHYTYPREFSENFLDDEDVLVMGHTHVQAYRVFDDGIVVNPGSVGQPRDGDHRAAFAVVDLAEWTVEEHRVDYDTDAVISKVVEEGLPREIGFRLAQGR